MKRFLVLSFLYLTSLVFGQKTVNRFDDNSQTIFQNVEEKEANPKITISESGNGAGNPGDPAPIDDYIPLLIITAVGIIIYKARKNKNLLS